MAEDGDLKHAFHELGQGPFEHHQEGHAEQAQGDADADGEGLRLQQQLLGHEKGRQHQQEIVVVPVAVLGPVADQRMQQHDDDAAHEEVAAQVEQPAGP